MPPSDEAEYFAPAKNGLQIGGASAGSKFWKDEEPK
jgi:hypothetical protein